MIIQYERSIRWGLAIALGLGASVGGCSLDGSLGEEDAVDDGDEVLDDAIGTREQPLTFSSLSNFNESCSDPNGTNSVLAALAVATATELRRWQPRTDFEEFFGVYRLTSTGKAQCRDRDCWNTQAILDLQNAPNGEAEVRPGVMLDTLALRLAIHSADRDQLFTSFLNRVPDHEFQLLHSAPGGCDTFYWFDVTSLAEGASVSSVISSLQNNLAWVGGEDNPYIQFQSDSTMIGIDPTYGLNEIGSTCTGDCTAACTKMSSLDITGECCSCNGNKKFSRASWNASTYLCQ